MVDGGGVSWCFVVLVSTFPSETRPARPGSGMIPTKILPQAPQWLQMPPAPEAAATVPGQLALPSTEPEAKSMDEALIRALDKQAGTEAAHPKRVRMKET